MGNAAEVDTDEKLRCYALRIGESLYSKITNHIQLLKRFESRSHSKQSWLEAAVREKLEEEEKTHPENIPRDRYLAVKFNKLLSARIDRQITTIKKYRKSYSTKLWIIEAISTKLEKESHKIKRLLEDSQSS